MLDQWQRIAELFILPPGINLSMLAGGLLLARRRAGKPLILLATLSLFVFSLPAFAGLLFTLLEPYPALDAADLQLTDADAIVVLCAGQHTDQPEYGGQSVVGGFTLTRLRYAAWLQKRTGLPLIVSGGKVANASTTLAALAARTLRRQFQVDPVIQETRSRTTRENARFSAKLLKQNGWSRIYLVSHAWHLPRAVEAFEKQGLEVIPAPTAFGHSNKPLNRITDWLPNAKALLKSYYGLHELIGRLWYRISA